MAKNIYKEKKNESRAEELAQLIRNVKDVPMNQIMGAYIKLYPSGQHYKALCPFHADNHLGSFVVTPAKKIWRCFACDKGGDIVSFVMEYEGIRYLDAVYSIARQANLITEEEYKKFSRRKWDEDAVKSIRKRIEAEDKFDTTVIKADDWVCAEVYDAIPHVCGLSEAHREHLLKERGLSQDRLADFFTFPTRKKDLHKMVIDYLANKYKYKKSNDKYAFQKLSKIEEQFDIIPGFFRDDNGIAFVTYRGIGFVVRDEKGIAKAIHVRRDSAEQRYVWFSSGFAQSSEDLKGGAPSGAPCGVVYPRRKSGYVCITEGRFKAEQIAAKNNVAVYVSGVSTWRTTLPILNELRKTYGNRLYLMFDGDILKNPEVYHQLVTMAEELEKAGYRCLVLLWNPDDGKGFDDLVLNKGNDYTSFMKVAKLEDLKKKYEVSLKTALSKFQAKTVRDIKSKDVDEFKNEVLRNNIQAFSL